MTATDPLPDAPATASPGPSSRTVRRLVLGVAGLVVIVVVVLVTGPGSDGLPHDPRSAEPDGLLGLVRLLGELDVEVELASGAPADTDARVFVPADQLPAERRDGLVRFAERGGTVVVTGATAGLHDLEHRGASLVDVIGRTDRQPGCALLDEVDAVRHDAWASFVVPETGEGCFPVGDDVAWLVTVPRGQGTIVAVASAAPFTNELLAEADNAVLAALLFGDEPDDRLVVIERGPVGSGQTPLLELIPAGFLRGLWLLLAALGAALLWRARRLGPPVEERLPPVLPSAQLARSVGDLLQRAGDRGAAARRIRDDARREVRRVLRVPVDTPSTDLARWVPQRTGAAADDADRVLLDGPVNDDNALTALAAAAARLRAGLRRPEARTTPPGAGATPEPPTHVPPRPADDERSST